MARRAAAVGVVFGVLQLVRPSASHAWGFVEHEELARNAYRKACTALLTDSSPDMGAHALLADVACKNLEGQAVEYGLAAALSGDHLGDPADFLAKKGLLDAHSFLNYVILAKANSSHFHPEAPRVWRYYHNLAGERAIAARKASSFAERQRAFEEAFYLNAFGDHFLSDSFSAGHSSFARIASTPTASVFWHDRWNESGRGVIDREGREWFALGDGHLHDPRHRDGLRALDAAMMLSAKDFLLTFATGAAAEDRQREIWNRFPVRGTPVAVLEACLDNRAAEDKPRDCAETPTENLDSFQARVYSDLQLDLSIQGWSRLYHRSSVLAITPLVYAATKASFGGARIGMEYGMILGTNKDGIAFTFGGSMDIPIRYRFPGVFSHELSLHASFQIVSSIAPSERNPDGIDNVAVAVSAAWRINAELGYYIPFIAIGPALTFESLEHPSLGLFLTVGGSKVLSVQGGGLFRP